MQVARGGRSGGDARPCRPVSETASVTGRPPGVRGRVAPDTPLGGG